MQLHRSCSSKTLAYDKHVSKGLVEDFCFVLANPNPAIASKHHEPETRTSPLSEPETLIPPFCVKMSQHIFNQNKTIQKKPEVLVPSTMRRDGRRSQSLPLGFR